MSLKVLSRLSGTTEPKIDAIAADVNNAMNNGLDGLDIKGNQLVEHVKNETAAMKEAIEAATFGVPAPSLASMSAASVDAGINVTVTATDATVESGNNKGVLATTKGVMVRYKEGGYPANKEDGTLAFIDEDLFNVDGSGNRVAKAKTHLVVGLTKDHTYYFSAFPYTPQGAYNERLGAGNVASVKWVGDLTTLTVNVSRSDAIFDLGQVTATLTSTEGDSAITQSRTGDGAIVFDGVKGGSYTLSFNDVANHTKPSNQSIMLEGGVPKIVNVVYTTKTGSLANCSWDVISKVSKSGKASNYFSVGDTKNITVNGETLTMEIVGFNHDNLTAGGKAGITFGMKHLMKEKRRMNSSKTSRGGWTGSELYYWLTTTCYNGLPADLRSIIRAVDKKTSAGGGSSTIKTNSMKIFLFSEKEVGLSGISFAGEGEKYALFTNNSIRTKKMNNGSGSVYVWWLRSPSYIFNDYFCSIDTGGQCGSSEADEPIGVCFGFCV